MKTEHKKRMQRILSGALALAMMCGILSSTTLSAFAASDKQAYTNVTNMSSVIGEAKIDVWMTASTSDTAAGTVQLTGANITGTTFPMGSGDRQFTATANDGWVFDGWSTWVAAGSTNRENATYDVTVWGPVHYAFSNSSGAWSSEYNGTGDTISVNRITGLAAKVVFTLKANFNPTITATNGDHGTITYGDEGQKAVQYGYHSETYTITAADGYAISALIIDGEKVAVDAGTTTTTYTFENVTEPHTISFETESLYTVTFLNEDGTLLSTGSYAHGSTVTPPADPTKEAADGYTYTFAGWSPEVSTVTGDASYTATYRAAKVEFPVWTDDPYAGNEEADVAAGVYYGVYDAATHDAILAPKVVDASGAAIDGAQISYAVNGVPYEGEGVPQIINAGSYEIAISAIADQYEIADVVRTAVIDPAGLTITVADASKTYGTSDPDFSASTEGLKGEDSITYLLSRTVGREVGTYEITAVGTILNADGEDVTANYNITVVNGTFTIKAPNITVIIPTTPDDTGDTPEKVPAIVEETEDTGNTPDTAVAGAVVVIEEDEIPLATAPVEPDKDEAPEQEAPVVEMEEEEIPLIATPVTTSWALLNLLLAIGIGASCIAMLVGYFLNRNDDEGALHEQRDYRKLFSIAPAVLAAVCFAMTSDMSGAMVFVDKWSLVMIGIALVQASIVITSTRANSEESDYFA